MEQFEEKVSEIIEKARRNGVVISSYKICMKATVNNEEYDGYLPNNMALPSSTFKACNRDEEIDSLENFKTVLADNTDVSEYLSEVHRLIYLQRHGQVELYINSEPAVMESVHDDGLLLIRRCDEYCYTEYKSKNKSLDVRNGRLPNIQAITYTANTSLQCVNLPGSLYGKSVFIANGTGKKLQLTDEEYKFYIKLHPKILEDHKYISKKNGCLVFDHASFVGKIEPTHGYYYNIVDDGPTNHTMIVEKTPTKFPLIPGICQYFKNYITQVIFKTEYTNLERCINEVKFLVGDIPLKVEFNYWFFWFFCYLILSQKKWEVLKKKLMNT